MPTVTTHTVASYADYQQAQFAVDALSDRHFPVEHLAIVGAGLQSFEQITGRKRYGRAALEGLGSGIVIGGVLGWLWGLFSLFTPLVSAIVLALWGIVIGGVIGIIVGLIGHALTGGRRDFSSVSTIRAQRYDVVAQDGFAEAAERELAQVDAGARSAKPASVADEPARPTG